MTSQAATASAAPASLPVLDAVAAYHHAIDTQNGLGDIAKGFLTAENISHRYSFEFTIEKNHQHFGLAIYDVAYDVVLTFFLKFEWPPSQYYDIPIGYKDLQSSTKVVAHPPPEVLAAILDQKGPNFDNFLYKGSDVAVVSRENGDQGDWNVSERRFFSPKSGEGEQDLYDNIIFVPEDDTVDSSLKEGDGPENDFLLLISSFIRELKRGITDKLGRKGLKWDLPGFESTIVKAMRGNVDDPLIPLTSLVDIVYNGLERNPESSMIRRLLSVNPGLLVVIAACLVSFFVPWSSAITATQALLIVAVMAWIASLVAPFRVSPLDTSRVHSSDESSKALVKKVVGQQYQLYRKKVASLRVLRDLPSASLRDRLRSARVLGRVRKKIEDRDVMKLQEYLATMNFPSDVAVPSPFNDGSSPRPTHSYFY